MHMSTPARGALLHMMIIPLLVLCSWSLGWSSPQSSLIQVTMEYWAPYYSPALAMVPKGTSIHIVNPTSSPHTITHESCRKSGPCAFDTGTVHPGKDYLIPSLPPGRYPYYCELHPIMRGEIVVVSPTTLLSRPAAHDQAAETFSEKEP